MIFTNNVQIHFTGFIVEKMYADGSGKFDKDWRRINLVAVPPVPPGTPRYPSSAPQYPGCLPPAPGRGSAAANTLHLHIFSWNYSTHRTLVEFGFKKGFAPKGMRRLKSFRKLVSVQSNGVYSHLYFIGFRASMPTTINFANNLRHFNLVNSNHLSLEACVPLPFTGFGILWSPPNRVVAHCGQLQ